MKYSEWLDWDTRMLGVKVAKLLPDKFNPELLEQELAQLAEQGAQLVYWAADSQDLETQQAAQHCNGILTDHKLTYICDLTRLEFPSDLDDKVMEYSEELPNKDLVELAYASGMYSRFQADPNISETQFHAIYNEWITNSTKHLIAERVLVVPKGHRVAAMVTLGQKQERGDIGLLAVAQAERGKGLGKVLVQAAQQVFQAQSYQWSQVVTQKTNQPACALYERCGYTIEKLEHFYHFWLRN